MKKSKMAQGKAPTPFFFLRQKAVISSNDTGKQ